MAKDDQKGEKPSRKPKQTGKADEAHKSPEAQDEAQGGSAGVSGAVRKQRNNNGGGMPLNSEQVEVSTLLLDPSNARQHDARNVESIKASLQRFGQQKPIVVDGRGVVVAGNGTLVAARSLGWGTVAVVRTDLQGAEATAYAIADNRTAELAAWDEDVLAQTLASLQNDESIDELTTGFTAEEIEQMIGKNEVRVGGEEDEVPAPPVDPVTQPGDLILLGDHRLVCGDSMDDSVVSLVLDGCKAEMAFTDPPYALFGNSTGVSGVVDDKMVQPFFKSIGCTFVRHLAQFAHAYVCCDWHSAMVVHRSLSAAGLTGKNLCVWAKGDGGIGANYQNCYELVWFFANSPHHTGTLGKKKTGERTVSGVGNIWRVPRIHGSERFHNAQKPVDLVKTPIKHASKSGDLVLDLFAGSGTTLIACEQLGRKCAVVEMEPACCDVIVQRWENLTGKKVERVAAP